MDLKPGTKVKVRNGMIGEIVKHHSGTDFYILHFFDFDKGHSEFWNVDYRDFSVIEEDSFPVPGETIMKIKEMEIV